MTSDLLFSADAMEPLPGDGRVDVAWPQVIRVLVRSGIINLVPESELGTVELVLEKAVRSDTHSDGRTPPRNLRKVEEAELVVFTPKGQF